MITVAANLGAGKVLGEVTPQVDAALKQLTWPESTRYSMGGELRVQVPVINVPFRLIFALNPNARTQTDVNPFFFEKKRAIRFSVGRTF